VANRRALILALSGCGVLLLGAGGWLVLSLGTHALQEGKGEIDQASNCRTLLAKTTACHGEDTSFKECHYHFRADGIPDPQVCAAFLASPRDGSVAEAGSSHCPEASPAGWGGVSCEDYGLDPTMVCFRCMDKSSPETARFLLQGFDRSCEHGIVLKSCNEPIPQGGEREHPAKG
jgi:hypothetical protein